MARTSSDKFIRTPLEEYTALKPAQKRLCWLFYRSLQTHYKEGLDPRRKKVPGSINNWKACGAIKGYINSFHVIRNLPLRVTPIFANKNHALNTLKVGPLLRNNVMLS
jgi:hypothetical protein